MSQITQKEKSAYKDVTRHAMVQLSASICSLNYELIRHASWFNGHDENWLHIFITVTNIIQFANNLTKNHFRIS